MPSCCLTNSAEALKDLQTLIPQSGKISDQPACLFVDLETDQQASHMVRYKFSFRIGQNCFSLQVAVEGNIGSGKSTFLNYFQQFPIVKVGVFKISYFYFL